MNWLRYDPLIRTPSSLVSKPRPKAQYSKTYRVRWSTMMLVLKWTGMYWFWLARMIRSLSSVCCKPRQRLEKLALVTHDVIVEMKVGG